MLFEKLLRKKKVPPYYMELIMGTVYFSLILILFSCIIELSQNELLNSPELTICLLLISIIVSVIAVLLGCFFLDVIAFPLIKDRKKKRIITQDVIIIRYDNCPINIPIPGTPGWNTVLCFNYMEPFLQIIELTSYPVGTDRTPPLPIKFFIPAVYFTYHRQKDYMEIKEEYKRTKAEAKEYDDRNCDLFPEDIKKGDGNGSPTFYMTYKKMKELNKLFELVNPPEFRITKYEKSEVIISIEPIPGKEYPPEALECMEKINAMYP